MQHTSPIWAITSYYNPFRGLRRYANYRAFRRNLAIPLVTVEWSHEADFQLNQDDAEVLVQVSGGSLMWQKECLLNIALDYLPHESRYVAWLDCDIIIDDPEWPQKTIGLLATHGLVQLFEEVRHLPVCDTQRIDEKMARQQQPIHTQQGLVAQLKRGMPFYEENAEPGIPKKVIGSLGLGYAAHAEWLREARFYDAGIVGGGDRMFIAPLLDRLEECFRERPATPAHRRHYFGWLHRARGVLPMPHTFLPGKIYHLYHGELRNRNYQLRSAILTESGFDPELHIVKTPQRVWQWTNEAGELPARVLAYLASRRDS